MTDTTPQMVISGVPYAVTTVDGHAPSGLEDFVGLTTFVVSGRTGEHQVAGEGDDLHEETVRFYEKSAGGIGKDVRVWTLRPTDDDGICAEVA